MGYSHGTSVWYVIARSLCIRTNIVEPGTMSDDEMRQFDVKSLSDDGYIFLWVTGRAMELGRECLNIWGLVT